MEKNPVLNLRALDNAIAIYPYTSGGFRGVVAQLIIKSLGEPLSVEQLQQVIDAPKETLIRLQKHGWYVVKMNPKSSNARRIRNVLVTVVEIHHKSGEVSVFTIDDFASNSRVATRLLREDLTNVFSPIG